MSQGLTQTRKSHTKSRMGCSACKQRHQKCDETRPSCVNCLTARRHCPYLDVSADGNASTLSEDVPAIDQVGPEQPQDGFSHPPIQLLVNDVPRDLVYVELLQQWLFHTYRTCVGPRDRADAFVSIALNHALNVPFLMRCLLAVAALHKACTANPTLRDKYIGISERMQSECLAEFNSVVHNLNDDNIVPAFLFVFLTGIHRLCQTLSQTHRQDNFIASFTESMTFLRGLQAIVGRWWDVIKSSELSILIPDNSSPTARQSNASDVAAMIRLRELVDRPGMDAVARDVYNMAINGLETAYGDLDALSSSTSDESLGFVVVWMIVMPSAFVQYLQEGHVEALIIMAHCAPLLHFRSTCWAVRDAGKVLLSAVHAQLAVSWHPWLDWPRRIIDGD